MILGVICNLFCSCVNRKGNGRERTPRVSHALDVFKKETLPGVDVWEGERRKQWKCRLFAWETLIKLSSFCSRGWVKHWWKKKEKKYFYDKRVKKTEKFSCELSRKRVIFMGNVWGLENFFGGETARGRIIIKIATWKTMLKAQNPRFDC